MEIVRLKPVYKDYLWGGTKLRDEYNKSTTVNPLAESWEISVNNNGLSVVDSGKYAGKTLREYLDILPGSPLGKNIEGKEFPLLVKFIDAKDNLSIQVHPSDSYAQKNGDKFGKTESWTILDAEDGGFIYLGLKEDITRDRLKQLIESNKLESMLNKFEVKKGETYFIPAGTIHGIGKGVTICEVQQNSDTTYRLYDYDRRDKDGNPRDLHIEKGMEVSDLNRYQEKPSIGKSPVISCKYYRVDIVDGKVTKTIKVSRDSFLGIVITDGTGKIENLDYQKGDSFFVIAQDGEINIEGDGVFYVISVG